MDLNRLTVCCRRPILRINRLRSDLSRQALTCLIASFSACQRSTSLCTCSCCSWAFVTWRVCGLLVLFGFFSVFLGGIQARCAVSWSDEAWALVALRVFRGILLPFT